MAKKKKLSNITIKQVFETIIWPKRGLLLFGLFLILLRSGASLVLPKATQYLIDDVVVNKDMAMLKTIILVTVLAIITQAGSSFTLTRLLSVQAQKLIAQLRVKVQKRSFLYQSITSTVPNQAHWFLESCRMLRV